MILTAINFFIFGFLTASVILTLTLVFLFRNKKTGEEVENGKNRKTNRK